MSALSRPRTAWDEGVWVIALPRPLRSLLGRLRAKDGVWVAYWSDHSAPPVIFGTELEALRYANANLMGAKFVRYGEEWR